MAVELAQEIDITLLQPHPRNVEIYGQEDVSELVDYIRDSKWIKPLVISQHNRIISGHRRWQAAKSLGLTKVPYVKQVFETETHELMALLLENASRDKTPEQRIRESDTWKELEKDDAEKRQKELAGYRPNTKDDLPPSLAEGRGESREKLAQKVGMKKTTFEKAVKVVTTADEMIKQGEEDKGKALLKVLNEESVNAASILLHMPENRKDDILGLIASGKAEDYHEAKSISYRKNGGFNNIIEKEQRDAHIMDVMGSSDSPEWYTPPEIVEKVLELMGTIDLDPCSNSHEDPKVPAITRYTKEDDGLSKLWKGKTYLNPPYGTVIGIWTNKLIEAYKSGDVHEAIALLPGRIDTNWFNPLYEYLICIIKGRVQFENSPHHAPFPCVLVYLGENRDDFTKVFSSLGPIVERIA